VKLDAAALWVLPQLAGVADVNVVHQLPAPGRGNQDVFQGRCAHEVAAIVGVNVTVVLDDGIDADDLSYERGEESAVVSHRPAPPFRAAAF
jgi:hypothetical protein